MVICVPFAPLFPDLCGNQIANIKWIIGAGILGRVAIELESG